MATPRYRTCSPVHRWPRHAVFRLTERSRSVTIGNVTATAAARSTDVDGLRPIPRVEVAGDPHPAGALPARGGGAVRRQVEGGRGRFVRARRPRRHRAAAG